MCQCIKKTVMYLVICMVILIFSHDVSAQSTTRNNDKTAALFQAIRSGSIDELQKQLANGANANDTLGSYSALMVATLNGSVDQMKMLIDHGANVNYQSSDSI